MHYVFKLLRIAGIPAMSQTYMYSNYVCKCKTFQLHFQKHVNSELTVNSDCIITEFVSLPCFISLRDLILNDIKQCFGGFIFF